MGRSISRILFLGLLVAAGISAKNAVPSPAPRQIQHVIMLSIDGLKPQSYTDPNAHGLKIPTMREIVRDGAWSDGVAPVMPTVTYPSHTTMATGANPGTHGIVSNEKFDPLDSNKRGWMWYEEDIRVPTLWQLARQQGMRTALVHWPVTVGAKADLLVPESWRASIPEDLKLLRALSTPGVWDAVANEYPDFQTGMIPPLQTDSAFIDIACYAIQTLKPNLLMVHIPLVDHWEHETGPFSTEALAATENADAQIARLIAEAKKAGIWDSSVLVVLSDHGFAPISQKMRLNVLLHQHGFITLDDENHPTDWQASALSDGGTAFIYLRDSNDSATRQKLLDLLQPLAGAPGSGIRRIADHDQILAMGGDSAAFIALEAADGTTFSWGYTGKLQSPTNRRGTHGYFPDRSEMRSSLLVYGPGIGRGKISNARLIDIGPTVARWLGLNLTKAEGAPLAIPMRR